MFDTDLRHVAADPCLAEALLGQACQPGCPCDAHAAERWTDHADLWASPDGPVVTAQPWASPEDVRPAVEAFAEEHGLRAEIHSTGAWRGSVIVELRREAAPR